VVAGALAVANFLFGLSVGHAGIDPLEDLMLRQASVLEFSDFGAGHDGLVRQVPVKNELHGGVRKADKLQGDGIDADGVELARVRKFEDLWLRETRPSEVGGGIGAGKENLANMRVADEFDASVVADPRVLQFYNLSDFGIRDVQAFELLDIARPHPRLFQGAIVRQRMAVATGHQEHAHTEKQSSQPHDSIVMKAKEERRNCAWIIPGSKYRCAAIPSRLRLSFWWCGWRERIARRMKQSSKGQLPWWRLARGTSHLIDPFHSEDAGDLPDVNENRL
jgi:hypothetical protein